MKRDFSVKYGNREIKNPVLRGAVVSGAIVFGGVMVIALIPLVVILAIVLSPIMLPLHFILKAMGRKGCYRRTETETECKIEVTIDRESFSKMAP